MNKILKYSYFIAGFVLFAGMNACVKDRNDLATDFSNLQSLVEIRDNISGLGNDAGLANFSRASLSFSHDDETDTAYFYVNIASVNTLSTELTVTIGVDADALAAYNADATHTVKFDAMPDSIFSIPQTEFTIPAGERVALVMVIFHPSKFDQSKSYMLPVSITDADGINISGNYGTIYYHSIGNPNAGIYDYDPANPPIRYSYTGQIIYSYPGPYPGGYTTVDLRPYYPKTASPVDPTTISIPYANGFVDMLITQDPSTGDITNITLADLSTVSNFLVYYSSFDAVTKTFHIISHYNNVADPPGSGNDRIIDETFTKQ